MIPKFELGGMACALVAVGGILSAGNVEAVTIDGSATGPDGYTTNQVQTLATTWGARNALANFRSVQDGNTLNIFLGGVIGSKPQSQGSGESFLLFIDSKPGGISKISPTQITYLDEEGDITQEYYINSLAWDEVDGLTFEEGFLPDYAIRIGGGGTGVNRRAFVNRYDLAAGTFNISGEAHQANLSDGFISDMRAEWNGIGPLGDYATFPYGVEMALNLQGLGVTGAGTVKVMAILVDGIALEGSNQVLGSLPAGSTELGYGINLANFQTIAGTQTISIPVAGTGLDPAGDADGDGLLNGVETGTGTFSNSTNTGTSPTDSDSDDDGYPDGPEVNGTSALGYVSNPNIRNYTNMAVPGSFNLPEAWEANSAANSPSTAMSQVSTSLAGQYQWTLDYRFPVSQIGATGHKFTTGGTFAIQWGSGETPGLAVAGGNDIPGVVAAAGIHRFSFDQVTLACSFARVTFPNVPAFLAAYGVSAGTDTDGDGILNENEFTTNTDPTSADSDGDGLDDSETTPLVHTPLPALYAAWVSGFPTEHPSPESDPDSDGFSNLKEFYFGTSPVIHQGNLLTTERTGASLILRWQQAGVGVNYHLQQSATLTGPAPWQESAIVPVNDPDQTGVPAGFTRKQATIPAATGKLFLRVTAWEPTAPGGP